MEKDRISAQLLNLSVETIAALRLEACLPRESMHRPATVNDVLQN